jgi:hypothetical protein
MTPADDLLDPAGTHATEGERRVDRNVARVLELCPTTHVERTRDVIRVDIRTSHYPERGVTILVTPEAFELRLPTVEWTAGAYGPAASSRYLKRVRAERLTDEALVELIDDAIARRDAEIVPCRYCGQHTPTRTPPRTRLPRLR